MRTILIALLFALPSYGSEPAPADSPIESGYRSVSAYGLMHFILDENNELLGVFASEPEVRRTVNIDTIVEEFFPVQIIRYGRTGSLATDVLERLAHSERREQQSHGKDSFWQDLLVKRKEEEAAAQNIVDRLNTKE